MNNTKKDKVMYTAEEKVKTKNDRKILFKRKWEKY